MARIQYRRLTPAEWQYLIENYADDPPTINVIAPGQHSSGRYCQE